MNERSKGVNGGAGHRKRRLAMALLERRAAWGRRVVGRMMAGLAALVASSFAVEALAAVYGA